MNKYQVVKGSKGAYHIAENSNVKSFIMANGLCIFNIFETEKEANNYVKALYKIENQEKREIVFRAKPLYDNKWIYGSLVYTASTNKYFIVEHNEKELTSPCEVQEKTIGQFTNLYDKEKQEIYVGDIVIFNRHRNLPHYIPVPEVILWNQGDCAFQRFPYGNRITRGGAGKLLQPDMMPGCEIIGNIYDNPDLIFNEI